MTGIEWLVAQSRRTDLPGRLAVARPMCTTAKRELVIAQIDREWRTCDELVRLSGVSIYTVRRTVNDLVAHGQIEYLPGPANHARPDRFRAKR